MWFARFGNERRDPEPEQLTSLAEVLGRIPDPRRVRGRRYRRGSLLALCLVAVLGGATSLAGIARFAADTGYDLRKRLDRIGLGGVVVTATPRSGPGPCGTHSPRRMARTLNSAANWPAAAVRSAWHHPGPSAPADHVQSRSLPRPLLSRQRPARHLADEVRCATSISSAGVRAARRKPSNSAGDG